MKFFVTGNLGFIGSFLVERLLKDPANIVIGYDKDKSKTVIPYNSIVGNILDYQLLLSSIPRDVDIIIHLAAEHKDEGPTKEDYFNVNVKGTANLLRAASAKNIKRFIFFSSSSVYGNYHYANEKIVPRPIHSYGISKYSAESEIQAWVNKEPNVRAIILRPAAVYGPKNKANIFNLIYRVHKGNFILVGKGKNIKSFSYVKNVVSATIFIFNKFNKPINYFNLVDDPPLTIRDFVDLIRKVSGKNNFKNMIFLPYSVAFFSIYIVERVSNIINLKLFITINKLRKFSSFSQIDGSKIKESGFIQSFKTEDGISQTINWIDNTFTK